MQDSESYRPSLRFVIIVAVVLFVGATIWQGPFSYSEVCRKCGAIRDVTEWQVPFTRVRMFQRKSERETPVSRVLRSTSLVQKHQHQWLFISGGGNGIGCAIGNGRYIRPTVESEGVAQLINAAHRFGEADFRNKVLQTIFDPKTSDMVRMLAMSVPEKGFAQASDLHSWISEESECFDEMVAGFDKMTTKTPSDNVPH